MKVNYEGSFYIKVGRKYLKTDIDTAYIETLQKQIEKMKNRKVFLLQRVDSYGSSIDKQFYTTDEELAKEWNDYYKRNYYYGEAIELEEFSDKERVKEELEK